MIFCARVRYTEGMNPWTRRLKDIGLTQPMLAARLGVSNQSVNDGLKAGNTRYTELIRALEIMDDEQRQRWLAGEDVAS